MNTHRLGFYDESQKKLFDASPKYFWKQFSDGETLKVTIIFPEKKPPYEGGKTKTPAAIFFHGGLWKSGSPAEFILFALHLAKQGIMSLLFEYRQTENYDVNSDEIIDDSRDAWEWTLNNAMALNIDTSKIIVFGSDLGASLALNLSQRYKKNFWWTRKSKQNVVAIPAAYILFRPLTHLADLPDIYRLFSSVNQLNAFDPSKNIKKGLPPLLLGTGGQDKIIQSKNTHKFYKKYKCKSNLVYEIPLEASPQAFYHFSLSPLIFEYTLNRLYYFLKNCQIIEEIPEDDAALYLL